MNNRTIETVITVLLFIDMIKDCVSYFIQKNLMSLSFENHVSPKCQPFMSFVFKLFSYHF